MLNLPLVFGVCVESNQVEHYSGAQPVAVKDIRLDKQKSLSRHKGTLGLTSLIHK